MRIAILSLVILSLSACTLGSKDTTPTASTETDTNTTSTTTTVSEVADGTYVTLHYTLRDGAVDGPILETTRYDVATANNMGGSESDYNPFSVLLGAGQLIPGFENALIGLKTGDKKVIEVPPELGYGTGPVLSTIPKFQIAPVFTLVQDKSVFADIVTETVERVDLPDDMRDAQVGQVFTGANDATARVVQANTDNITLEIANTNNPFYKKKIEVGATAESAGGEAIFKITKISGTGVTLEITNKNSPFYNKNFAPGESIDTPSGKIEIQEILEDDIVIAQYHPMVGKTLFFDIEILDIK